MMAGPLASGERRAGCSGFAYLFLLIAVAVIGGVAALSVQIGSTMTRHDAELHLRVIGQSFSHALDSYAAVTPPGQVPAPKTLEQLLRDDRFPTVLRHLRRVYDDPVTGEAQWGLIRDGQGFIVGVHSLSDSVPVGLAPSSASVMVAPEGACQAYRCWVFQRSMLVLLPGQVGLAKPFAAAPSR